ncbi:hypothetical protein, conserved [Eimeria necatrix]|uniref:Uncharacterized protein n=1 Tax=Eimeria necatrix TaxID=51315 RepID=U6MLM9_9EIME|nr:hypothetical protein, conserved [Eimeria necatrix]CDJ63988.1 hypothetical protein, conserved [Eimeria necatrix]
MQAPGSLLVLRVRKISCGTQRSPRAAASRSKEGISRFRDLQTLKTFQTLLHGAFYCTIFADLLVFQRLGHPSLSSSGRLHTMSQDLAFVEERLVRALQKPQMDHSLTQTLDRLRALREMVAAIQAKHSEVTSLWDSIAAAARSQACCLQYLQTLQAVAEANGCLQQQPEGLCASAEEFAKYLWPREFSMDSSQPYLPSLSFAGSSFSSNLAPVGAGQESPSMQGMSGSAARPAKEPKCS